MNVLYFILKDSKWMVWKKIHKRGELDYDKGISCGG